MNYPDSAKTWQLLINGSDCIDLLQRDSLRGQDSEGSAVDSLSFTLVDQAGTLALTPMQTVKLVASGSTVFGGFIQEVNVEPNPAWVYPVYKMTAVSWHELLRKAETAVKSYAGATTKAILGDIFIQAGLSGYDTTSYVQTGPTLTTFTLPLTNVADAIDLLALAAGGAEGGEGYVWRVTGDAEIVFQAAGDEEADFDVADFGSSTYLVGGDVYPLEREGLRMGISQTDFFNRVVMDLGKQAGEEITDLFNGDGVTYIFPLSKAPVEDVIGVWVNGTAKRDGSVTYDTIGLNGVECVIDYGGSALWFAPGAAPGVGTENVKITFRQLENIAYVYTSAAGYALAGNRWITKRVRHSGLTTKEQAEQTATALLEMYATAFPKTISFKVRRLGLLAGQEVEVSAPAALKMSGRYVIRSVDYVFDKAQQSIVASVQAGTRSVRFSDFLDRASPAKQAALEQPTTPQTDNSVGVQRLQQRFEALQTGTVLDLTAMALLEELIA